ncbi:hypothetical protein FOPE_06044 [Fonsecaea pedrosoi]|nr:hypothetical protein FOPE_06044 [Fonsecaea pedrosoi]
MVPKAQQEEPGDKEGQENVSLVSEQRSVLETAMQLDSYPPGIEIVPATADGQFSSAQAHPESGEQALPDVGMRDFALVEDLSEPLNRGVVNENGSQVYLDNVFSNTWDD